MAAHDTAARERPRARRRGLRPLGLGLWWWLLLALAVGVLLGAGVGLVQSRHHTAALSTVAAAPVATWQAGERRAPDFRLADARGAPISLRQFRGRPVIVTFLDPVCHSLCPLEAAELNRALSLLPAAKRPAVVSVSVNPWADSRAAFRADARKWRLGPEWHWAAGPHALLAPVWKRYAIGVLQTKKTVNGVVVRDVSHTEASYLVDANGYERAVFLYPFRGADVAAAVERVS
ncbi:MAG TPA: SCO family protein [Gaiellaceae bacterium]|nr:SCO family protein [Gaiellaceae bacterium]